MMFALLFGLINLSNNNNVFNFRFKNTVSNFR